MDANAENRSLQGEMASLKLMVTATVKLVQVQNYYVCITYWLNEEIKDVKLSRIQDGKALKNESISASDEKLLTSVHSAEAIKGKRIR